MSDACRLKRCGDREYFCTVELSLQVIGGKWKPLILYRLGQAERLRFSELKRRIPSITQKMLTQQLRELEADRVVERTVYPQVPPRVEYNLTDLGRTVMPVMDALCAWGREFERTVAAAEGRDAA
jgi:DNA-binding HxlR family transcriptional regulator